MRVVVTGGAGFIGSNYVRHLLATGGAEVTVLDALTYAGDPRTLDDLAVDPRVRVLRGDVTDAEAVAAAVGGGAGTTVVHFAAETHVDRSIVAPDAFVRTNCVGTAVVCDVARRLGVDRLVHVSTDEVYGPVVAGAAEEGDPLRPTSPYAASKAAADLVALSYHRTHGLPVVVARPCNALGPRQYPEKLVPLFVTRLLDGAEAPLYGDGRQVREWCHVDDLCAAVDLLRRAGRPGEVYNVGTGARRTNRDLVDRLVALCGAAPDQVRPVADRPAHDRRYALDARRVRALGWAPRHDLDAALAATVAWYRANRWWWEPLARRRAWSPPWAGPPDLPGGPAGGLPLGAPEPSRLEDLHP